MRANHGDNAESRRTNEADGSYANTVELSGGGPDRAPLTRNMLLPRWPGVIAHTRHGDEHLYLRGGHVYTVSDAIDMRCGSCTAGATVALDHLAEIIVFVVEHARGCQAIEDLLAMNGVSA